MTRSRVAAAWVVLACAVVVADAEGQPSGAPKLDRFTLQNGVQLFVREEPGASLVAIDLAFDTGRRNDPVVGFTGLVYELLTAASTRHVRSADRDSIVRALGFHPWATKVVGGVRATHVSATVPRRALDLALWLESDRVGYFTDGIDERSVASALTRYREERNSRTARQRLQQEALKAALADGGRGAFFASFPALGKLSPRQVKDHVRQRFGADRLSISVVGDVGPKEVQALVARHFGDLARADGRPLPVAPHPAPKTTVALELTDEVSEESICVSWRTSAYMTPNDIVLDVVARLLLARLTRRLFDQTNQAQWLYVQQSSLPDVSVFSTCGTVTSGGNVAELRKVFEGELAELAAGRIEEAEIAIGRNARLIETTSTLDDLMAVSREINAGWWRQRAPTQFWEYRDVYRRIDRAAVTRVVKSELGGAPAAVVIQRNGKRTPEPAPEREPKGGATRSTALPPSGPSRARPPAVAPARRATFPQVTDARLSNGVRLLVQERPAALGLMLRMTARWGEKHRCCYLPWMVGASIQYAELPDGRTLRRAIVELGTTPQLSYDEESVEFTVRILPEQLEETARLLTTALLHGKFDAKGFDSRHKSAVEGKRKEGGGQKLSDWMDASRLPPRWPGRDSAAASLKELEALDLTKVEAARARLRTGALAFSVLGPVSPDSARRSIESATREVTKRGTARPLEHFQPGATLVEDPELDRAYVAILVPLGRWGGADHAEGVALRWYFGTGTDVRPNLRERMTEAKLAQTSDHFANTLAFGNTLYLVLRATTAPADAARWVGAVLAQFDTLRQGAIPPVGVNAARRELLAWLVDGASSTDLWLGNMAMMAAVDAPSDAFASLYARGWLIDQPRLKATAERYLRAERMRVVAVGKFDGLRPALEELGLAVNPVKP